MSTGHNLRGQEDREGSGEVYVYVRRVEGGKLDHEAALLPSHTHRKD